MKTPPTLPGAPVVGSLAAMRQNPVNVLMGAAALGDVVHVHFPKQESLVLAHPDHAKHVLVDNFRNYQKNTRGYAALRIGLGEGLVTSQGTFWRRQRRIAQPAFHKRRIAAFGETMTRATEAMLDRWAKRPAGSVVDVNEAMMQLTLRIVGECLLSTDLSDDGDAVGQALTTLLHGVIDRVTNPLAMPLDWPLPRNKAVKAAIANLDEVVLRVIADRRKTADDDGDLLNMLLHARDEETGEQMTDRQLRDEVMTIVLAGHETTATALTWTLALISRHPAVAEKLLAEIDEVLEGRTATIDDLGQLAYTTAVIKESMRLFPPVWLVARSVEEDDTIDGYAVPRGYVVFVSPYVLHRDARFWENPEGFQPERHLGDAAKARHKLAYMPFVAGPRKCIGDGFAMMEAQLILSTIVQRFRLDMVAGQSMEAKPTVTLRPKHGMRMTLHPRG